MPRIEHFALYCIDLEVMRAFYEKYFGAKAGEKYHNISKGFQSYFLSFEDGARLEIMSKVGIDKENKIEEYLGFSHLAISVGSKENVDSLTKMLENDGFEIIGQPRTTGDGYYESLVFDSERNRIEITI